MPYSGFLPITTLPPPTLIPAPPRAPQPELLNYSNTPQFSTQPINFANTDKTSGSDLPQPIHTVSNIHDTPHVTSLLSDTSNSDSISSHFSSPTASQIANNPFNSPQGQITNFECLLSQAHWNHSFNLSIHHLLSKLAATQFSGYTTHYQFQLKFTDTRSRTTFSSLYWETTRQNTNLPNTTTKIRS